MVDSGLGPVHEDAPAQCPRGHPWGPNQVLVGWMPCQCAKVGGGHRYYACRSCDAVVYWPDHREAKSHPMEHPSAPAGPLAGRGRGSRMGECTFTVHSGNHRAKQIVFVVGVS